MEYLESKEAFENAVKNGLENPEDYMYMYLTWSSFFVTLLRLFYAVYLFSNGVSPFNEECGLLEL
jgi:hypothetical protein